MSLIPVIYMASPYNDEDPKVVEMRYESVSMIAGKLMLKHKIAPILPISSFHSVVKHSDISALGWDYWAQIDTALLSKADELWVIMIDGWVESTGVNAEVDIAKGMGLRVRYVDPETLTIR